MRNSICTVAFVLLGMVTSQAQNKNMSLLGHLAYTSSTLHGDLNDVWGYVDSTGREYAIVGLQKGVSIVDVTDPSSPTEKFYTPGVSTIWRDIKTWNKHAYVTNQLSGGLMIIDMSALPGAIKTSDVSYFTGSSYTFGKAHNLFIDENGVAYIFGANYGKGGAIFLDLTVNPKVPVELGVFDTLYLHDGMARGDTLWGAAIYQGFFVAVDVSNKSNPVVMKYHTTSGYFTHNCWISDNGKYLFTTDEISSGAIGAYDVSNLANIQEMGIIQSNPGSNVIPHNTHVKGNFLVTSYYRDGVTVVDATYPDRMVQVGNYDTSPILNGNGFNGCWGVYPWLPSGNVIATDIENGLYIIGVDYIQGTYIQGNTRKFSDSSKISTVKINSVFTSQTLYSNLNGFYKSAFPDSGSYKLAFEKPGYLPDTIDAFLKSGQLTVADIYMRSDVPFKITGTVKSAITLGGIEKAKVFLESKYHSYRVETDALGNFAVDSVYEGEYEITAGGLYGHVNQCLTRSITFGAKVNFSLYDGIYYDFTFPKNEWQTSGSGNGNWDWDDFSETALINTLDFPTSDVGNDCSHFAVVTGNYTTGDHDVDGGWKYLYSPLIDASSLKNPELTLSYWFKNDASVNQDDTLIFMLVDFNSGDTVTLQKIHNQVNALSSQWVEVSYPLAALGVELSAFKFVAKIGDFGNDHLLEAALDRFIVSSSTVGINENTSSGKTQLYPNPVENVLYYVLPGMENNGQYKIYNHQGVSVMQGKLTTQRGQINVDALNRGVYILKFSGQTWSESQRFVKMASKSQ